MPIVNLFCTMRSFGQPQPKDIQYWEKESFAESLRSWRLSERQITNCTYPLAGAAFMAVRLPRRGKKRQLFGLTTDRTATRAAPAKES
jgi:hypothetical protein